MKDIIIIANGNTYRVVKEATRAELEDITQDITEVELIKKYDSCTGCIHKPKVEGVDSYGDECGSCARFYGDSWDDGSEE